MQLTCLKSKIHQARVTHTEVDYEGSCAIDINLLQAAHIREYEQIDIYNATNGERLTTYAINAEAGSGIISLNGAAALKASVNDVIIICTYAIFNQSEMSSYEPRLVYCDAQNNIKNIKHQIATQAA